MAHEESGGAPGETRAAERLATLPREERRLLIAMAAVTVTPPAVAMLSSRTTPEILVGLPLLAAAVALYGWCVTRRRPAAAPAALAVPAVLAVLAYGPLPAAWWLSVSALLLFVLGRFVETACALRRTCPESVAEEVARSRMRTDRRLQELLHAKLAEIETRGARVRLLLDENDGAASASASAELAEVAALANNTQQVLREFAHREFWAGPADPDGDEHHR